MLARVAAYAEQQAVAVAARLWSYAPRRRPTQAPRHLIEARPMSREDSWVRATRAVTTALSGFERVQSLHAAATDQIDAADYVLRSLIDDLRLAMPIPADGAPLRAILAAASRPASPRKALAA